MEVKGKVHEVSAEIQVSEKFKKRELILVVAENPQYPEHVKFEAAQDKTSLLDGLKPGQYVELFFNLRGRAWTDKAGKTSYFNTLSIWKINKLEQTPEYASPVDISSAPDDEDELPF